ncbi:MAG: hypothetical protein JWM20_291 [Patescibacteria group bacterium]|nr:hypothetical protein [Patescibacteria group bacterium]
MDRYFVTRVCWKRFENYPSNQDLVHAVIFKTKNNNHMNTINFTNVSLAGEHLNSFAASMIKLFSGITKINQLVANQSNMSRSDAVAVFDAMVRNLSKADAKWITRFTDSMISAIEARQVDQITANFNDVTVTVDGSSTVESILSFYELETKRRSEEYKNSPAGKADAKKNFDERNSLTKKAESLLEKLPALNFNDNVAVLNWLCELQPAADRVGVEIPGKEIVKTFNEKGFATGANTGKDFNGEDEDNFARYIIGQALDMLEKYNTIHHMCTKFTDDWKKKFNKTNSPLSLK